jgi:hypothetical protein
MANQTWFFRSFPAPNGAQAAVNFLNQPARQGHGEATATLRNDGTAGLMYLGPGSLGNGTQQTWFFREFPAPNGAQAAVNFLNQPARQGPGEATVTPRGTGAVGLIYLGPGSLGNGTQQTWFFREFPAPNGAQAAVNFLNQPARQGPGEASGFIRNNGSAVVFYLGPGTG